MELCLTVEIVNSSPVSRFDSVIRELNLCKLVSIPHQQIIFLLFCVC